MKILTSALRDRRVFRNPEVLARVGNVSCDLETPMRASINRFAHSIDASTFDDNGVSDQVDELFRSLNLLKRSPDPLG
jgi:hypothetical protein